LICQWPSRSGYRTRGLLTASRMSAWQKIIDSTVPHLGRRYPEDGTF
jgi:hypothetical protein